MNVGLSRMILSSAIVISSTVLMATQAKSTDSEIIAEDGRVLLYKQKLEDVYFNNWTGLKVAGSPSNQVDVHILGEGKSVDFNGILSINCSSGSGYFWKTAANFDDSLSEADLNETVPIEVIAKSKATFCVSDSD